MALFMSSCEDDENPTNPDPSELKIGDMSATVNGSSWKAQNAIYFNIARNVTGGQVDITNPVNGVKKTITITLATTDEIAKGTYTAICFYQESAGMPPNTTLKSWNDMSGSCEVTEISETEIKGTFTFKGVNEEDGSTKDIKGSFYVSRK